MSVEERFAELPGGMRLCFTDEGEGPPILLVIGLSFQLVHWPRALIDGLVAGGNRVIAFDNRDSGRSSYTDGPIPTLRRMLTRKAAPGSYDLGDMAGDAFGLLDALGIERAHVVGMSMGGMIGQVMAASRPERVLSLTSIFSTTGARKVGQPGLRMMLELSRRPSRDREAFIARRMRMSQLLGGRGFPADKAESEAIFARAWDRAGAKQQAGAGRQIGAIMASGDRTAALAGVRAPTLVIHGDRDPLVHPSGGEATARAIPGARHETVHGMGHEISTAVAPRLVGLIGENLARAAAEEVPA